MDGGDTQTLPAEIVDATTSPLHLFMPACAQEPPRQTFTTLNLFYFQSNKKTVGF